jgi:EpsD family peptidyl-prolyl cis-trans isomerase
MKTTRLRCVIALLAIPILGACGHKEGGVSQVAAKVDKGEITVHQVNFALQRLGVNAENANKAMPQVLSQLVEQELLVQAAMQKKLDRDPQVAQMLEEARREVLARAYLEQMAGHQGKPTDAEVRDYYEKHPALFAERRIYSLRELVVPVSAAEKVKAQLEKSTNLEELAGALARDNIPTSVNQIVKPAEQLPIELLPRLLTMKEGDVLPLANAQGVNVIQLVASRSNPVDEKQARPAIEQFLANQHRNELVQGELKRLKDGAKVEFVGDFAKLAAGQPLPVQSQPVAKTSSVAPLAAQSVAEIIKGM